MRKLLGRLPVPFRVLYRQFLLRVVDLESLSVQADIPRFLGQFAGVLILISMVKAMGFMIRADEPWVNASRRLSATWSTEQDLIALMMLVAGLIAVVSWDAIFPDRRDALVLGPLPVRPGMILLAKVAATGGILGLAVLALNFAPGVAIPLFLGGISRFVWFFAAFWFTMVAATFFLYGAVLTVQGIAALLLPRRMFLRLSAVLQLSAFGLFLAMFFLQPVLATPATITSAENHRALAYLPAFWFFAMLNQLMGHLPASLGWLAWRAWMGLGVVAVGASASLLLCYKRTMRKTVEEPDLVPGTWGMPGARGRKWTPRFGGALKTAVVLFSARVLARSRNHRMILAFYWSLVLGIALYAMNGAWRTASPRSLTANFLEYTCMMMGFAVLGLRSILSLPISLKANWVLRVTQLEPPEKYIGATRRVLLLFAVLPAWICAALLSLWFRPLYACAAHLAVLALIGVILADLSLIGVSKIPFACSYLPGKTNIQYMFWGILILFSAASAMFGRLEERALHEPVKLAWLVGILCVVDAGLWAFNRYRAKSAALLFEDEMPEVITTLGLASMGPVAQVRTVEKLL